MDSLAIRFQEIKKTDLWLVGGKGLNLGELTKIQEIRVPEGFCVTTVGYQQAVEQNKMYQHLVQRLSMLKVEDQDQIRKISKEIRKTIMEVEIPSDVTKAVAEFLSLYGEEHAYAVRSSATAEDLPYASFAGHKTPI